VVVLVAAEVTIPVLATDFLVVVRTAGVVVRDAAPVQEVVPLSDADEDLEPVETEAAVKDPTGVEEPAVELEPALETTLDEVAAVVEPVSVGTLVLEAGTEAAVVEVVGAAVVEVVVASALVRPAEYLEQAAAPAEAACTKSPPEQAVMIHGATTASMALYPEPHWQPSSFAPHPAATIPALIHGIAQSGCPE
jgi:hypothetical protein